MKMAALFLIVVLALVELAAFAAPAADITLTPQALFGGACEGNGTLKLLFGKRRAYHVNSNGQVLADGRFRLDQTVMFQGEPATRRHWILTTVQPASFTGTLSDAAGKVTGRSEGARLLLKYRVKGPLVMQQTLQMMRDGTIDNIGTITLLGIPVGHLQETIRRKSAPADSPTG